jgi:hypothetical protein
MNRNRFFLVLALAWAAAGSVRSAAAEWQETYAGLLRRHVTAKGVDYRGWSSDKSDLGRLAEVVRSIASEAPSGTRNQRLAWYLNAYNALVLHKLLLVYPADLTDSGRRARFFQDRDLVIAGDRMSLEDLEVRVLRQTFRDPRLHFALNRGTASSPALPDRPFHAATLEADLDARTREFLRHHPHGVRSAESGHRVAVSRMFEWFREDFEGGDVQRFISRHRTDPLPPGVSLEYLAYDWGRNDG